MSSITINNIECYIIFKDSSFTKFLKDNNFTHKIKIRYSKCLLDRVKLFWERYGIQLIEYTKSSRRTDKEYTKKYGFDKLMYYDNTNGTYEKCGYYSIFTKSKVENDNLSDFIREEIKNYIYDKTSIKKDKITNSINSNIDKDKYDNKVFVGDNGIEIKYKINILSLGRYTDKLGTTHKILTEMKIHHYLFVEEKEFELYNNWINQEYCILINSGENYSILKEGGQHMRNFIIEYWLSKGEEFIWMLDDNIQGYKRLYDGFKIDIKSKEIFTSIEHYISHIDNIGICSHNIQTLVRPNSIRPCLLINSKHFSSLLINIRTGIRFRFKYNEDHIFSIDTINQGFQSICFNHILYDKITSGRQTGGNAEIYGSQGNNEGYNQKCFTTLNLLKEEINNKLINVSNEDKIFKVSKKKISKNNYVSHLGINYDYIVSDKNLRFNKEIVDFNSSMVLV